MKMSVINSAFYFLDSPAYITRLVSYLSHPHSFLSSHSGPYPNDFSSGHHGTLTHVIPPVFSFHFISSPRLPSNHSLIIIDQFPLLHTSQYHISLLRSFPICNNYLLISIYPTKQCITLRQKWYLSFPSLWDFPGGLGGKESACNAGNLGSIPGLGRFPGEGNGNPLPVFLPGEFHGQRSLTGYSP